MKQEKSESRQVISVYMALVPPCFFLWVYNKNHKKEKNNEKNWYILCCYLLSECICKHTDFWAKNKKQTIQEFCVCYRNSDTEQLNTKSCKLLTEADKVKEEFASKIMKGMIILEFSDSMCAKKAVVAENANELTSEESIVAILKSKNCEIALSTCATPGELRKCVDQDNKENGKGL